ncbi:MAG: DUF3307 domain-containing protein [Rhizomicrobium sp.]
MQLILAALLLFQIKHFVCDFLLQPYRMVIKKGIYLHPMGLLHAGLHALGSLPALLLLSRAPQAIAIVILGEFVIHYHTDWTKAQLDKHLKLDNHSSLHWAIFGADQMIHQMTYLVMVYAISRFP